MADIEVNKRHDPKASLALLQQLKKADVDLQTLQNAKTEKFLRELSSMPLTIYQTSKGDFEAMKKQAKDILKIWADQRRRQILFSEEKVQQVKKKGSSVAAPKSLKEDELYQDGE